MISQFISPVASSIPFDNSTNGYTANNVQAAIEETNQHLLAIEISNTATATASSTTDTLMTGMTATISPGTYLVWFSCDINSATAGAAVSVSLYNNGVQVPQSLRKIIPFSGGTLTSGSGRGAVAINGLITVTAGALEVRWSVSSGSVTASARTFNFLRVL